MKRFSQAYKAAQGVIKNKQFSDKLEKLRISRLNTLFADNNGPNAAEATALEEVRKILFAKQKELFKAGGVTQDQASARAIINSLGSPKDKHDKQRRAATLKMLKHFYHGITAGGQTLWIYSPPISYQTWIFDYINGTASDIGMEKTLMESYPEVYSKRQRDIMCTALLKSRDVALSVVAKLSGTPNKATLKVVKQYFSDATTTDIELNQIIDSLRSGFQKLANACNSNKIIFSDEPGDRNNGGWDDWAFVDLTEDLNVVYLQNAWLKKANKCSPTNLEPLYLCVLAIIHELSHKELRTEDICYDFHGLNPHGATTPLRASYALHNADSWAYFAIDVLGYLTGPSKEMGSRLNSYIRQAPRRTLALS